MKSLVIVAVLVLSVQANSTQKAMSTEGNIMPGILMNNSPSVSSSGSRPAPSNVPLQGVSEDEKKNTSKKPSVPTIITAPALTVKNKRNRREILLTTTQAATRKTREVSTVARKVREAQMASTTHLPSTERH